MKAAMMTEAAVVPGVCGLQNLNPAIDKRGWNIEVPVDTTPWPPGFEERRAGVSSFGYGGTNGHVVIEAIDSLMPSYSHGHKKRGGDEPAKSTRPFLLPLSAHDRTTLERNIVAHGTVAADYHLADLAYTLSARRSRLRTRGFVIASDPLHSASDWDVSAFTMSDNPCDGEPPGVAFIFTGQGAQWAGMGTQAMATFGSFRSTVETLDRVLQQLEPGIRPTWTLESALSSSIDISKAEVAQPVCTAVQIAMVDLLASWGIVPTVTVGHSSGEIAAAYAAGRISAPEAMIAAYLRGYAVQRHAPVGSMLAVGLGIAGLGEYHDRIGLGDDDDDDDMVIACQNSPESVTLSGTPEAITRAQTILTDSRVFARELPTGKAYHSGHMQSVAATYDVLLGKAITELDEESLSWRQERTRWFSSVTGGEYMDDHVPASYWSTNLLQRVLFDEAVTALGTAPGSRSGRGANRRGNRTSCCPRRPL